MLIRPKARKRSFDAALASMASPDPDRARALAQTLVADVRADVWALARYDADGNLCEFISSPDTADSPLTRALLESETTLQRRAGTGMPVVASTKVSLDPLRFGLTALYGSRHRVVGTLILARHASDGPFTARERNALAASLERTSEDLRRLSIFEGEEAAQTQIQQRSFPASFVLNEHFDVEWRWCPPDDDSDVLSTMLSVDDRLPPAIEHAVRDAVAEWTDDPASWQEAVVLPLPFIVSRIFPLTREGGGRYIGVHVERYQSRNALRAAVKQFNLSPRELEVLALLLQGRGSIEIAHGLGIAESTVNDHIKRLLAKTKARNRVDLAAKALGWRAPSHGFSSKSP